MIKKSCILLLLMGLFSLVTVAQNPFYRVVDDDFQRLSIVFATGDIHASTLELDQQTFASLWIAGMGASSKVGQPCLPTFSDLIRVPMCDGYRVTVTEAVFDTVEGASLGVTEWVAPLQPSRSKSDTTRHALEIDKERYQLDAFLGDEWASVEKIGIARDRNLARLQFSPIRYNPVRNQFVICRKARVTVIYENPDEAATRDLADRYYSPAFTLGSATLNTLYPMTHVGSTPIRYLIVAHSSFRGLMDTFVEWKRRKGFLTDIVYTDDPEVGATNTSIADYVRQQYVNASEAMPAPTYLLLVGDVEQVPPFAGTTSSAAHVTDLPYSCWTEGDHLPDCYYGRFSAQVAADLTPQVEKTLMYEQYTFADPTYLDRAVMVAGVDNGRTTDFGYYYADPAMDYAITHYINGSRGYSQVNYFKNDTTIVPTATNMTLGNNRATNAAHIRTFYSQGAGWCNYSAHGSSNGWATPNFGIDHVNAMTNNQKMGIYIGNCCLSNKFDVPVCFGEALLRQGDYRGGVGYIGASNSTYWSEDLYWAVGYRSYVGPSMNMSYYANYQGAYDHLFHAYGQSHDQWAATMGEILTTGNMKVEASTSSDNMKYYYWEVYHLMGDPSLMPYLTQANTMTLTAPNSAVRGTASISVQAVPYAYIALTDTATREILSVAYANASGAATLALPQDIMMGSYEIAASAQQYRTTFRMLQITLPDGPFVVAEIVPDTIAAGHVAHLSGRLINYGNSGASNIVVDFSCADSAIAILSRSLSVGSIGAGDTLGLDTLITLSSEQTVPDLHTFSIGTATVWQRNDTPIRTLTPMVVGAPQLEVHYTTYPHFVLPGNSYQVVASVTNHGHARLEPQQVRLASSHWLAHRSASTPSLLSMAPGEDGQLAYTLTIDPAMPLGINLPLFLTWPNPWTVYDDTIHVLVGRQIVETFEDDTFHFAGWTQGDNPWMFANGTSANGVSSLRSMQGLGHGDTSAITIQRHSPIDDSISFYYRVSSENGFDLLTLAIDGQRVFTESGNKGWTRSVHPISAGDHTFTFAYTKDGSYSVGSDCAWIDDVMLPQAERPWRVIRDTLSHGERKTVLGYVLNGASVGDFYISDTTRDTMIFIQYHVLDQLANGDVLEVCDSIIINGVVYTESTTIPNGDSPLTLIIKHSTSAMDVRTENDAYCWLDGVTYLHDTIGPSYRTTNAQGCDSLITLSLTINHQGFRISAHSVPASAGYFEGTGTFNLGDRVNITAIAHPHYTFQQWSDGETNPTRTVVVNDSAQLEAWFTPDLMEFSYSSDNLSMGTVTEDNPPLAPSSVTIGTATTNSYIPPFYPYYNHVTTQSLYKAAEINESGVIDTLKFNCVSTASASFTDLKIYLGTTTQTTLAQGWASFDNLQLVYHRVGGVQGGTIGWESYPLDTPFEYDGTDNLVVVVCRHTNSYTTQLRYQYSDVNGCYLFRGDDSDASFGTLEGSVSGSNSTKRANIAITFQGADPLHRPFESQITLTAQPHEGYYFDHWSDNVSTNPRTVILTQDTHLVAYFTDIAPTPDTIRDTIIQHDTIYSCRTVELQLNPNDTALGQCAGNGTYPVGAEVQLLAIPTTRHHFVAWSDGNTDNPRRLTLTTDLTLTAIFAQQEE